MTNKLKPCPFCGGEAEERTDNDDSPCNHDDWFYIKCKNCNAQSGMTYKSREEPILWRNTRVK